jgi:hypothetical protein
MFTNPMKYIQTPTLTNWVEVIPRAVYWSYPSITSWANSLAYSDSTWYVLTGAGNNDGVLYCIKYGGGILKTFSFPSSRAMDVSNGYLWLAGRYNLEKRRLSDTVIVASYDLTESVKGNNPYSWIQAIAVTDNSIYIMASWNRFLTYSINGVLIDTGSSYTSIYDLAVEKGRLWCTTLTDKFFELDPITKHALHSYLIVNPYQGRYQGITVSENKIACADNWYNYLRIYEVAMP